MAEMKQQREKSVSRFPHIGKILILLLLMGGWLVLMWRLSAANGTETLKDSMRFAKKIGALLYQNPTAEQLAALNLKLRKMAHVFLYAGLGTMMTRLFHWLLYRFSIWKQAIPAIVCCTIIAFADELQKIPIAGRHFSFSESLLNAGSAAAMTGILLLSCWVKTHKSTSA